MANIKVTNLNASIAGTDLFDDSESFMRELSEDELNLEGGCWHRCHFFSFWQN
jgi:hypothetical protein